MRVYAVPICLVGWRQAKPAAHEIPPLAAPRLSLAMLATLGSAMRKAWRQLSYLSARARPA
jgi:hypothetical protein